MKLKLFNYTIYLFLILLFRYWTIFINVLYQYFDIEYILSFFFFFFSFQITLHPDYVKLTVNPNIPRDTAIDGGALSKGIDSFFRRRLLRFGVWFGGIATRKASGYCFLELRIIYIIVGGKLLKLRGCTRCGGGSCWCNGAS